MKKILTFLMASLLFFALAACSDSSSSTETSETETAESTETTDAEEEVDEAESAEDEAESTGDISELEEIYEKAMERQSEIKSMSSEMVMDQKMVFEESGETYEMGSKSDLKSDFTMDPFASYMVGTISTVDPSTGESIEMDTEMYMLPDAFYMYEATSDTWMELPTEGMEEILGKTTNQIDAAEQLKQLESIMSEFNIEEEGDEYILTLDAAGDKFTEYVIEQMKLLGNVGITEAEEEIVDIIKYDKVHYVLKMNKDTYDMTAMDMVLHMSLEEDDEKLVVELDSKMTFSNFNEVEAIEVPQDVIDNAVQMEN